MAETEKTLGLESFMKDHTQRMCEDMTAQKDSTILSALKAAGADIADLTSLAKRCEIHILWDGTERFLFNGNPIIEFHNIKFPPVTQNDGKFEFNVEQKYRILIDQ